MTGDALTWDIFLRGIAIGCLLATGAALARAATNPHARIAGVLFALSTAAYALNSSQTLLGLLAPAIPFIWTLSVMGAGLAWLFLIVLFEDRRIGPRTLAPAGAQLVLGLIGMAAPPQLQAPVWISYNLVAVALGLHALAFVSRSWRDDLVEARRRLRGPFLTAVAVYVVSIAAIQISESLGHDAPWHRLAGSVSLALFCLVGTATFLTSRESLFGPAVRGAPDPAIAPVSPGDPQDRIIADRLADAMAKDALWRREGLTIGTLAGALGAPEHRVRRVINGHLGHRNFAAFVNAHRIEAAKAALGAPDNATRTVAAIAFDLGFGSLGPFNRAFKDATGLTPTEFRNRTLQSASPNSGNPC